MPTPTDADFADFVSASSVRLFRTAYAVCGDRHRAEDALQAALGRASVSWRRVSASANPEAWVRGMVVDQLFTRRGLRALRPQIPPGPVPEPPARTADGLRTEVDLVRHVVDELSPRRRAAVVLRHFPDLSEGEVAEQRLVEAIAERVRAQPAPHVDAAQVRARGRRQQRRRRVRTVLASTLLVAGTILAASALEDEGGRSTPVDLGPLDFSRGVRAFVDRGARAVHVGGRRVPLEDVPGLDATGLATPNGVLYVTPDQELRIVGESGRQRVLMTAVGTPPPGFTPSVGYDESTGTAVVLSITPPTVDATVSAYDVATGDLRDRRRLRSADGTRAVLEGADHGVAAIDYGGAGVLSWVWGARGPDVSEWAPSGRRVVDLRNRVVLLERVAQDSIGLTWGGPPTYADPTARWRYLPGRVGDRLDATGRFRVRSAWSRTDAVLTSTRPGRDALPVHDLPAGERIALSFDTDGSVLAAVSTGSAVELYDCAPAEDACAPIGLLESTPSGAPFLDGAQR